MTLYKYVFVNEYGGYFPYHQDSRLLTIEIEANSYDEAWDALVKFVKEPSKWDYAKRIDKY